jgi:hypothetical protein
MCGIVGMIDAAASGFYNQDRQVFFGMMLLNSFRGIHSTGAMGVDKQNRTDFLKCLKDPYQWNQWDVSEEFMTRMLTRYWAVVGHGRSATQGAITPKNAHPFLQGKITLVHNGTLTNLTQLNTRHKQEFEVDSQMISYLISQIGIEAALKEISGAYCLVYTDSEDGSINMIRNSERPLEIGTYHRDSNLVFASERHVLKWASEKGQSIKSIASLPTNELWSFRKENGNLIKTVKSIYKTYSAPASNYGSYKRATQYYGIDDREDLIINGKEYKEGDDIRFTVLDVVENKGHMNPSYVNVKGTAVNDTKVQVTGSMPMSETEFIELFTDQKAEMILIGKIRNYVETNISTGFHFRVFVETPRVYPEVGKDLISKVAGILLPPETSPLALPAPKQEGQKSQGKVVELKPKQEDKVMVKTADGTYMSVKRFKNFALMGCKICNNHPTVEEAGETLTTFRQNSSGWELYCPKCVADSNHDLNVLQMKVQH